MDNSGSVKSEKKKMFNKADVRVSTSGRKIKTPKSILTTSDDEIEAKKHKKGSTIDKALQALRDMAKKTPKNAERKSSEKKSIPFPKKDVIVAKKPSSNDKFVVKDSGVSKFHQTKTNSMPLNPTISKHNMQDFTKHSKESIEESFEEPRSSELGTEKIIFDPNFSITSKDSGMIHKLDVPIISKETLINADDILRRLEALEGKCAEVVDENRKIFKRVENIWNLLQTRYGTEQEFDNKLYQPLTGFPLSTVEQFKDFDNDKNKKLRKQVHDHLVLLGGSKLKDFLSTSLREIMTDELVSKFTWNKQKESEQFGNTKVSNVFYCAAQKCPRFSGPENKEIYKLTMLEVIKSTKQRNRNKLNKKPKNKPESGGRDRAKPNSDFDKAIDKIKEAFLESQNEESTNEESDGVDGGDEATDKGSENEDFASENEWERAEGGKDFGD